MTATALLMPYFAFQLPARSNNDSFTLSLQFLGLLKHPCVCQCVFERPYSPKTNIFGEVLGHAKNVRFRNLRQMGRRIHTVCNLR